MRLKSCMLMCSLFMASLASASNFASDSFKTKSGKELIITFIKHGSLMLTYDNHSIRRSCLRIRRLYDFPESRYHLDYPRAWRPSGPESDTSRREKRYGNHRQREQPKETGKREGPKNGDTDTSISYMKIEAVPAYNTTPGRDKYHPRHRDNGYILTFDGLRVYIAGDTEDIPEMKDLKDIDIAFLPVNQPYTMTVPQAAKAAKMFSPKILYPYHYGDTKIGELKDALKGSGIDVRIRELQ